MFAEDLSAFFSTAEFATAATLNGVAVAGIFDTPLALGVVGEYGMASTQPAYTLPSVSVPANPVGLALVIGATSYVVAAHEPDGTGVSRLLLERAV